MTAMRARSSGPRRSVARARRRDGRRARARQQRHRTSDHDQSACARAAVEDRAVPTYRLSGTPADCVVVGAFDLCGGMPALLVSGINRGANVGDDLNYSGTVAAAVEGTIIGIPSLAISLAASWPEQGSEHHWETAAATAVQMGAEILAEGSAASDAAQRQRSQRTGTRTARHSLGAPRAQRIPRPARSAHRPARRHVLLAVGRLRPVRYRGRHRPRCRARRLCQRHAADDRPHQSRRTRPPSARTQDRERNARGLLLA